MTLFPRLALTLAALLATTPALADVVAHAASPDGNIVVSVSIDGDGRPTYAVTRHGKPMIADSRLGFLFTDAPKMERYFTLLGQQTSHSDTSWKQPWGEWQTIRDDHTELTVKLREGKDLQREMDVVFRIFDDGVGFRYVLPAQPNLKTVHIADELTEFAVAEDGTAWWIPGGEWNRYEYLYNKTPISGIAQAHTPLTVKLADGTHIAFHEAALVDYSSMWLRRVDGTKLKAVLSPGTTAAKVTRATPFATPWRTMIITDDAPGLYMSHIELNLNEPNKLGDVSWIHPAKFVGIWWNMIKGTWSWATGPQHGATTAHAKGYIDFAAANGIRGVLVEGWNPGWNGDWLGHGNDFDFAKATPDFDVDYLAKYAASKGVHLIGHHETGGAVSHYEDQFDRAFAFAQAHGEEVVKTGYVTDAGQIEHVLTNGTVLREWHDGQWMSNHHIRVLQAAAKYHVSIDSHEPIKDTGLRRTYPNWLAREGARGMEYNAWEGKNPPEHEENLIFTRMLSGPMDFTPGVLSLVDAGGHPILSTVAKQLALYVALYSPVVMAADTPEAYVQYPGPFQFIRDVPTDWQDTLVLNGEVGDYATIVRKAKGGDDWFLGSVNDENARTLKVPLDFLDAGRSYRAEIYRDGPGADYRTDKRHSITIEKKVVKRGDTLSLALAPGGGEAIRFVVLGKGGTG